jgi:hypothetical protein
VSDIIEAIDALINQLKLLPFRHEYASWEMSETKTRKDLDEKHRNWNEFAENLRSELRGAIRLGADYKLTMASCAEAVHTVESGIFNHATFGELELLRLKVSDGLPPETNDWIRFKACDAKVDDSTLGRHLKKFPDRIKKGVRGEWFVIREYKSDYIEGES